MVSGTASSVGLEPRGTFGVALEYTARSCSGFGMGKNLCERLHSITGSNLMGLALL